MLKKLFKKNQLLPWTKRTQFSSLNKNNYSDFTHVVYAQSFTDAQCLWGNDEFHNLKEWLLFTIENLAKNKNNKILLKSHPNFYKKKKKLLFGIKLYLRIVLKNFLITG